MKTIYKYEMPSEDRPSIQMPDGAEILTVQRQNNAICLWAMVEPNNPPTIRHFETFGTGQIIPGDMGIERRYIGSVQEKFYVWHVFERIN